MLLFETRLWELVRSDLGHNVVGYKYIFHIKCNSYGSINKFKARLVVKGFHQQLGVDYHSTFSLIVKPTTVQLVLSPVISCVWSLSQLDANNTHILNFFDFIFYFLTTSCV